MEEKLYVECERIWIRPLSVEELHIILEEKEQQIIDQSILSENIKLAIEHKIQNMNLMPEEVHPWFTYWMIQKAGEIKGIGLIGSKGLPRENGFVELGYVMARAERNHGYATEALDGMTDWLWECPACLGVHLQILTANVPSRRIAEKCGFIHTGVNDIYEQYDLEFRR